MYEKAENAHYRGEKGYTDKYTSDSLNVSQSAIDARKRGELPWDEWTGEYLKHFIHVKLKCLGFKNSEIEDAIAQIECETWTYIKVNILIKTRRHYEGKGNKSEQFFKLSEQKLVILLDRLRRFNPDKINYEERRKDDG